jgi:hypothetical protein
MTIELPERRSGDSLDAFQVRAAIIAIGSRRHPLTATEAQFLLRELARLPADRWPAAGSATTIMSAALSVGWPVAFAEDEQRALLRAVEGVRARRTLSPGLSTLRDTLLHSG